MTNAASDSPPPSQVIAANTDEAWSVVQVLGVVYTVYVTLTVWSAATR